MKNKIFSIIIFGLLPIGAVMAEQASPSLTQLPFMRELQQSGTVENAELGMLEFDSVIYEKSSASFSDIRFAGTNNIEIPYMIKKETVPHIEKTKKNCSSQILSLNKIDANKYEITVELDDKEPVPDEAVFKTPCQNFEKRVSVYGSDNQKQWKLLSDNTAIFDYSQMVDLKNISVKFAQEKFRYYKFEVDNFKELKKSPRTQLTIETRQGQDYSKIEKIEQSEETFKITGITLISHINRETVKKDKTSDYPFQSFSKEKDKENEKNDIVTIETFRQPLTELKLVTASSNFHRSITVYGSDNKKDWQYITAGKVSNISFGNFREEDLSLRFAEKHYRYYKLIISNGDSPSLDLTDIKLYGNVYSAKFILPKKNMEPLKIFYGSKKLEAPIYDIGIVLNNAPAAKTAIFAMGTVAQNPLCTQKSEIKKSELPYEKYIFIGAISLMVIILAWLLLKGIRKIESLPDGQ